MKYSEICSQIADAKAKLERVWQESYQQAKKELRGNWLEPDVQRRWKDRALEIANETLEATVVTVIWQDRQTLVET